jgi:hypothetical protein
VLTGAFLFIFIWLCAIAFLAGRHCGPAFGYYGCEAPVANNGSAQVARSPRVRLPLRAQYFASARGATQTINANDRSKNSQSGVRRCVGPDVGPDAASNSNKLK